MKRFIPKLSAMFVSVCMLMPALSNEAAINSAFAADTEAPSLMFNDEDEFFVYVGTNGYEEKIPEFVYYHPNEEGYYVHRKVLWKDAPSDVEYGDIFMANEEVPMTLEYPAADDPANAYASYYAIDEGAPALYNIGNCDDIMKKKELKCTNALYSGSKYWSIYFTDADDLSYYYSLCTYGSSYVIDPTDWFNGEFITYAMYNDITLVIPLEMHITVEVTEINDSSLLVKFADFSDLDMTVTIPTKYLDSNITPSIGTKLEVYYAGDLDYGSDPRQFENIKKVTLDPDTNVQEQIKPAENDKEETAEDTQTTGNTTTVATTSDSTTSITTAVTSESVSETTDTTTSEAASTSSDTTTEAVTTESETTTAIERTDAETSVSAEITTAADNDETLPQTGYSNIYKVITGLAALMTVSGAAIVVKTRKENE